MAPTDDPGVSYLRAARRSWYVILIGPLVGAGLGWLALHETTRHYEATVQLSIGYGNGAFANEVASRDQAAERAQTFVQIAPARPVLAAAAEAAGYRDVRATVTAAAPEKSSLFTVTVDSPDQDAVAPIANAYPQVLIPQIVDLVGPLDGDVRLNVVNRASRPAAATSPVPSRDLGLGLIGGFLAGLLLAMLREALERAVRTPEQVAQVADLRLLGTVPGDASGESLPTVTRPRSARAEAYRQVRTVWLALKPRAQVIAVTSSIQGEGKTTLSTNLAISVARSGRSVVIVDADLRRPRLGDVFELDPEAPGLATVLAGDAELDDVICDLGPAMPAVIPAGGLPEDPSELLDQPLLVDLLDQLRARYDYVVVDTPPTLPVTDTLVVAPHMDAILLVARIGTATPQRLRRSINALERVDAFVAGVIANGATGSAAVDYRRGYYFYAAGPTKAPKRRSDERRSSGKRAARN